MYRIPSVRFRQSVAAGLLIAVATWTGCARPYSVGPSQQTDELWADVAHRVSWFAPELPGDVARLARWRRSVGPPVVVPGAGAAPVASRLIVVTWNVHVGGGDIARLFGDVRREAGADLPIVLLLQEAYRGGSDVPGSLGPGASFASVIRGLRRDGAREEVEAVASALGLHAYYVPSMRNGGPLTSDEDRGNAILSTVPLADLAAIELPFESQRRVAVAATVSGATAGGDPWRLRVVSAHLDTRAGAGGLWIAGGERARTRQARGLLAALGGTAPMVLGADLNSWFGFRDGAYLEAARAFPDTRVSDRRATFRGLLRLDHLFFRLDDRWNARFHRAGDTYGSDHHPLIGTIAFD